MESQSKEEAQAVSRRKLIGSAGTLAAGAVLAGAQSAGAHEVSINAMTPTPEQVAEFLALPDGPVVMVNLLKFKADGGREEYAKYSAKVAVILEKIGARVLFQGEAQVCLLGNADWDAVALVEYPDKTDLMKMSQSAEYQAIHHHREAGLEGQVNYAVTQT